ncbi:cytochrome c oxidase assembly protein COX20, mitochondrial-like [Pomacea canaliculata]|uniref:cytochrome c oxidase assembly protein COX20, mitochondrial-like n=1 Tax=Pomacea canaliculata TaxID=400727 RepID=UPI000D728E99|nr:cytochrome c oxidase assembly protein COX20, mitochondrial-like [Pomacea canaliculata]
MSDPTSDGDADKSIAKFSIEPSKIPCFRRSFLTGIGGGLGIGVGSFLITSNVRRSTNIGVGSYALITMGTWLYCRYTFAKEKIRQRQIKKVIQSRIAYEGTEAEIVSNIKE